MNMLSKMALAAALLITAGCATPQTTAWVSPEAKSGLPIAYAILPFVDANAWPDKKNFPEAAYVVREVFESALLQSGHKVVAQGHEDATVEGTVTCYFRGKLMGGRYTTVGFEVKAVSKRTGAVLWKVGSTQRTYYFYNYEPAALAKKMADELVKRLPPSGRLP